jgi:hypothetical protein
MATSRKDYIYIADAIAEFTTKHNQRDMQCLAIKLAEYFKQSNPLFSSSRFITACEPALTPRLTELLHEPTYLDSGSA